MGSPLSPIIANMFMEHFETRALESAPLKPKLWLRYVDDTFIIWPHDRQHLGNFFNHLNNQHRDIKFTMEIEDNNCIPFLDTLITKPDSGPVQHQVYRKPTHTDRYLHYKSFHHPSVTQSVANTLVRRAYTISDQRHLQMELDHVKTALQENGYPPHKMKTTRPTSSNTDSPQSTVIIPFIGPASFKIQRTLQKANIQVRHSSVTKLHSLLHTHKDKKDPHSNPGVYKIPCNCGKVYIGETGRSISTRLKEHKACYRQSQWEKSAIVKHAQQENHVIDWENSQLIHRTPNWYNRRVREAIEIFKHNTVPQDTGLHISSIWNPLLRSAHLDSQNQNEHQPIRTQDSINQSADISS